ncbi:flagellar biosynthetic protein FliO [Hoeflea prorocentri]|uniref:Flagellar biosynthetic protein FliO n=1 Tax=Hoeflea prorocentri TaxID=1922333 RepID=A0A9X3ZGX2_9HYPH|nr:flagellar biosynthetic protein FliO [Hoeflea prorocentri]MCY6380338.1 flagellar biosynthetic protein FliO [Hoeflea prorocentri]MDA5398138.1 flagellar biosynthetic protein FliO [Hoeflea prorocentri]
MGDALIGTDGMSLYSMIAIGVVIVAAIAVIVWNMRRRGHMAFMRGGTNRQPRLAILDAAAVDARRRLVLIRRDNVEHLVMIGGPSDIVVERGINRSAARAAQQENAAASAGQGAGQTSRPAQQRPPQPKAPPAKPASEPIATEPLNIPTSKPDEPPAPAKPPAAAELKDVKPAQQQPAAAAKPKAEPAPAPAPQPKTAPPTPAPELAAMAVSSVAAAQAVEASAETTDTEDAIAAELEDALEAARDLVMPDPEPETPPAPPAQAEAPAIMTPQTPPKAIQPVADAAQARPAPQPESVPEAPVVSDAVNLSPAITADDLIADFDKVLEAEISKTEQDPIKATTTDVDEIAPVSEQKPEQTASAPSASLEDEMKKLLGDLTVKH